MSAKLTIEGLLSEAGIGIDRQDRLSIRVNDPVFYPYVLANGSLGLGESYMQGWWDCSALDEFFCKIFMAKLDSRLRRGLVSLVQAGAARLINQQTRSRSRRVVRQHYDIGNDFYEQMLDRRMIYSCAYWQDAEDLDEAQEKKLALICRKMRLEKGMRLLDIGCGWGGLARYAAENFGVSVVGVTISKQQAAFARVVNRGLPVDIRFQDYRDLHDTFDRVVSVGMFEHVGYKNYAVFMRTVAASLTGDGTCLLHTIGGSTSVHSTDPWMERYIFPGSMLPSARQITEAAEGSLVLEDWHNFGVYYDRTCMQWLMNVERCWPYLSRSYDETFFRMWKYYLSLSAASFRVRKNHLWQIVLTKPESGQAYVSVR